MLYTEKTIHGNKNETKKWWVLKCERAFGTHCRICYIYFSRLTVMTSYEDFPFFNLIFFLRVTKLLVVFFPKYIYSFLSFLISHQMLI